LRSLGAPRENLESAREQSHHKRAGAKRPRIRRSLSSRAQVERRGSHGTFAELTPTHSTFHALLCS